MKRIKLRLNITVLLIVYLMLGSPFYTWAQEVGRITYVEGRVDISKSEEELAVPAREEEVVFVGDAVRTKSNSKAEITFKDKSVLRLAENSRVKITDYQLDAENKRKTATIDLERGKIRTIIEKMADAADFKIYTPNAQGTIKGSDIFAFYQAGNSGMMVSTGNLQVINPTLQAPPMMIPPGNSVLVPLDQAPKGPRPYFELEKKFFEQDTNPPPTISRREDAIRIEGIVTKVSGDVKIMQEGSQKTAEVNQIVRMGDSIETANDGMIELKFDNGNGLNLKPNTKIILTKLVIDPKTREYENFFEVSVGQVKATVENIKGGSSFQIKTPHAISGVRGTLMYLIITSILTKSLFEGGPGFITSLISGETKEVPMGQSASADDQGSVSDPAPVSADERLQFAEGWEPGSGIEGYSSPDNVTGRYLYDLDTSVETVGQAGGEEGPDTAEGTTEDTGTTDNPEIPITETSTALVASSGTTSPLVEEEPSPVEEEPSPVEEEPPPVEEEPPPVEEEPPPVEEEPPPVEEEPPPVEEEPPPVEEEPPPPAPEPTFLLGELDATFGRFNSDLNQPEFGFGSMNGSLESSDLSFDANKEFNLSGTFSLPEPPNENFDRLWGGMVEGEYDDGSRYWGLLGGTHINNDLDGMLYALFVGPDGNGGFLSGFLSSNNISGAFDSDTGTFSAEGNLGINLIGFPTAIAPNQLFDGSEEIIVDDISPGLISGDIQGAVNGQTFTLSDQDDWEIFQVGLGGTYEALPTNNWLAVVGGIDGEDHSFWVGHGVGSSWENNKLNGTVFGRILDDETYGVFQGDILGAYDDTANTWEALGGGSAIFTSLEFRSQGVVEGKFGTYTSGIFDGDIVNDQFRARLGGFGSFADINNGQYFLTMLGQFENSDNHGLWATGDFFKSQALQGVTVLGRIGGINVNDSLEGLFNAFYIRPDGDGGFLAGYLRETDFIGSFYPGIGMFEADALVDSFLDVPTIYSPSDLLNDTAFEENELITAYVGRGDFGILGTLEVQSGQIEDQDWGLWFGYNGGSFGGVPSGPWEAAIGGSAFNEELDFFNNFIYGSVTGDALENNELIGSVSGKFLYVNTFGVFSGDLLGTYDETTNQWQGFSTGVFETTAELDSSGELTFLISKFGSHNFFNRISGLIGLTRASEITDLWSTQEANFVSIGKFSTDMTDLNTQRFIWHSGGPNLGVGSFFSYTHDPDFPFFTTFPDDNGVGAFYGIAGGIGSKRVLFGKTYGFYADQEGNTGTFSGTLLGEYADNPRAQVFPPSQDPTGEYILESLNPLVPNAPRSSGINPADLVGMIWRQELKGDGSTASGQFDAGGTIFESEVLGNFFMLGAEDWGIFNITTHGIYDVSEGSTSDGWELRSITGLTGIPSGIGLIGGSWLAKIDGTSWSFAEGDINDNFLEGNLSAIWVALRDNGTLSGRQMLGEVVGNYTDVDEESLWQATSTGEWVEVDDLLDLTGTEDDIVALGTEDIPITEVYTSLLEGDGTFEAGGTLTLQNFFIDFFVMDLATASGIWAANLNGDFTGPTGNDFTIDASGDLIENLSGEVIGTVDATLTGTEWSDGKWQADVSGSTDTGISLNGVAAGTFDNPTPGTFAGAGTGVWEVQEE